MDREPEVFTISEPVEVLTPNGPLTVQHLKSSELEGILVSRQSDTRKPTPVRVQSSCVFSEALGAIDCDCASQLQAALGIITSEGGYVIYMYEEGRGAGLEAKFAAIHLQQTLGIDTAAAFDELGLPHDPRTYTLAGSVLQHLVGNEPIELLTNNPHKVRELQALGVNVVATRPLLSARGAAAEHYLVEKARVLGHVLDTTWDRLRTHGLAHTDHNDPDVGSPRRSQPRD